MARPKGANLAAMRASVADFLTAAGLDPRSRALRDTPSLVAKAWHDDFLDGYRVDPSEVLRERMPVNGRHPTMVLLDRIDYVSVCPHHLLPSRGVARVAYVPGRWIVGLGQLSRLVDAFAHRLVLQEDLGEAVADALMRELGARGAACALEAEHACLRLRGEKVPRAVTYTEALRGSFERDAGLRRRFAARPQERKR